MEMFTDVNWVLAIGGVAIGVGGGLASKTLKESLGRTIYAFGIIAIIVENIN